MLEIFIQDIYFIMYEWGTGFIEEEEHNEKEQEWWIKAANPFILPITKIFILDTTFQVAW